MGEENIVRPIYYSDAVIPENLSLPVFMMREMEKFHHRVAVIEMDSGKSHTYGKLIKEIHELTSGLQAKGLLKGEVVAIVSSNCYEYFIITMAVLSLGAIITTANPGYNLEELGRQFNETRVKFVFVQQDKLRPIRQLRQHVTSIQEIYVISYETESPNFETIADLEYLGRTEPTVRFPKINPKNDACLILYSSGTSGMPKGVVLTHYNLVANICQTTPVGKAKNSDKLLIPMSAKDVVYGSFPHFHSAGITISLFCPLVRGTRLLIAPRFKGEAFLIAAEKYKVTVLILVPPVFVFLSESPLVEEYDLSGVKALVCGAAPLPEHVARNVVRKLGGNPYVIQGYGMTELSPNGMMMIYDEKSRNRLNSAGVLLPSTECKVIREDDGKCCGPNEPGEILLRGPQVMKGYLNNPEATGQIKTMDGFIKTGDVGYYDSEGFFYIVDRLKELIKVRGFQVAPAELEEIILTHPAVSDAMVIGVPDNYSGEVPRAYVIIRKGHSANEQAIKQHVASRVVKYKELAGGVKFVKELPKAASGKAIRRILKAEAAKEAQKAKL